MTVQWIIYASGFVYFLYLFGLGILDVFLWCEASKEEQNLKILAFLILCNLMWPICLFPAYCELVLKNQCKEN